MNAAENITITYFQNDHIRRKHILHIEIIVLLFIVESAKLFLGVIILLVFILSGHHLLFPLFL